MTGTGPRIPPLPRSEWTEDARDIFAIMGDQSARETGSASNLVMTMANHPAMAKAFYGFGKQLLLNSTLPDRPRELVTLRVAWLYKAEYEWAHHVAFARRIGITEDEIDAVKQGSGAATWTGLDRDVISMVEQLCANARIDDDTWDRLAAALDRRQLMDLVMTVGQYVMLAWAISAFGVEVEPAARVEEHPLG